MYFSFLSKFEPFWHPKIRLHNTIYGRLENLISKCLSIRKILHYVLASRMRFSLSTEHIIFDGIQRTHCISYAFLTFFFNFHNSWFYHQRSFHFVVKSKLILQTLLLQNCYLIWLINKLIRFEFLLLILVINRR